MKKIVSITMDGAPTMSGQNWILVFLNKMSIFPLLIYPTTGYILEIFVVSFPKQTLGNAPLI